MLCEKCNKKSATVHLTQIVNNKKTEMHLCEECANKSSFISHTKSFGFEPEFSFQSFLSDLIGSDYVFSDKSAASCPKCGTSQRDIAKGNLLGCAKCYDTFKEQLLPVIKRIHGTTQHVGKVPEERTAGKTKLVKKLRDLKSLLKDAVSKEEFERAAKIRDEIKALEKKLGVV
ncbi:MAG: UvrB/UvrC motif-containing protein [Desulfotomaculum sp.]|nr:UvrB/UvrC motif-containing protein [Desulfotomaculum sp.]